MEGFTQNLMYFPEMDSLTINFQNAEYWSAYIIPNLGLPIYLLGVHFIFIPLVLLLKTCTKLCPKARCVADKAEEYVFWNGSMRFFMEGYLDFCMLSLLNVKHLDWSD